MKKKVTKCPNCGEAAKVERGVWPFEELGLPNVVLLGLDILRCPSCGEEAPMIHKFDQLMATIATAIIAKHDGLTGAEVRFLRKRLGLTQAEFSLLVAVSKTHVSKWENDDDPVGPQSDKLIRHIMLVHDEELHKRAGDLIGPLKQEHLRPKKTTIEIDTPTMQYHYA